MDKGEPELDTVAPPQAEIQEDGDNGDNDDIGDNDAVQPEDGLMGGSSMSGVRWLTAVDQDTGNHRDSDDAQEQRVLIVNDQPFMDAFHLLGEMEEDDQATAIDRIHAEPIDVDRWEVVLSPELYVTKFRDTLATVRLIDRAPWRKLHTTYHRGPGFDNWLLLAQANHQIWVDPRFKDGFFKSLNKYHTAQPGHLAAQASMGQATISAAVFTHCLTRAGCDTVRIKAYGQKMPLTPQFLKSEPADNNHRWAVHNEWDIGTTFDSPHIWLFSSMTGRRHGIQHYPMMVPGSRDFGTVNLKVKHNNQLFSVKIYPRIVHVIKSFNSHLQGTIPRTLGGVRHQVQGSLNMIHSLTGKDDMALGGFRIEVTVKAATLNLAKERVKTTGFLKPGYWLGFGDGPHHKDLIASRLVSRKDFLDNANWVYHRAAELEIFSGDNNRKPTLYQIKALTDVLNAVGWNGGLRSPSKSLNPAAWWNDNVVGADRNTGDAFGFLSTLCQTARDISVLFDTARRLAGKIPCKLHPDDALHRYEKNGVSPFRIRCRMAQCYHKLQGAAVIEWIAVLVRNNQVDWDSLCDQVEAAIGG